MSKITNKFLALAPANTLKGNNTGSSANVVDLTVSQTLTMLGLSAPNLWTVYTPTITGFGTVSASKATYKQVGDSLFLKIYFTAGTVAATLASFTLPSGFNLSVDNTNKIPILNTTSQSGIVVGSYFANIVDTNLTNSWTGAVVTAPSTSTTLIYLGKPPSAVSSTLIPANGNATCESTATMCLECEVILA
jgi:hypothetical protein